MNAIQAAITTAKQPIICHHCGQQIVWNETHPDRGNSHWAHAILVFNGKAHTLGNALMEQRCADNRHWATPKRTKANSNPKKP